jgi:hypothetical protein
MTALKDFCENDFNDKARELFAISEKLNDNWKINEINQKFYLTRRDVISIPTVLTDNDCDDEDQSIAKQNIGQELMSVEYHVVFHPSYRIPALYFNAYSGW